MVKQKNWSNGKWLTEKMVKWKNWVNRKVV